MKPSQEFKMMIVALLEKRQPSVSASDLDRHKNSTIDYYSISKITMEGAHVLNKTEPFGGKEMIEIAKGGASIKIGDDNKVAVYIQATPMSFSTHQGKGLVHWTVKNKHGATFTAVKLMSPDGYLQIKLIHPNQQTQLVYNVCELPQLITNVGLRSK